MARHPASPALDFFAPRDAAALTAALAWADREAVEFDADDAASSPWLLLRLPAPRLHPHAHALFAAAAGVPASALRAVIAGDAYIADDGTLRLWPWYPEEDADERPRAIDRAARLGLALPGELLDEPYEPAHYHRRAGIAAVRTWLAARGVDIVAALVDRVPIPGPALHPPRRFEGGLHARAPVIQAASEIRQAAQLHAYAHDDESRLHVERRLDLALARLCAAVRGDEPPISVDEQPRPIDAPHFTTQPLGRVDAVFALTRGPLLVCDGAFVALDHAGAFVHAWPTTMGSVFARNDVVVVNYGSVLDLAAGRWLDAGDLAPILARMGLRELPGTGGHDERTTPALSACGRYLLDVDESPFIVRLADGMVVAEGHALDRMLDPEARPRKPAPLLAADALDIAPATILDGVRFVVRAGPSPARDGRALAFALAGDRWRFLVGDTLWEHGRRIARVGAPLVGGAFSDDGRTCWALAPDHALRIDLTADPVVAAVAPLAPILAAAARVLAPEVADA